MIYYSKILNCIFLGQKNIIQKMILFTSFYYNISNNFDFMIYIQKLLKIWLSTMQYWSIVLISWTDIFCLQISFTIKNMIFTKMRTLKANLMAPAHNLQMLHLVKSGQKQWIKIVTSLSPQEYMPHILGRIFLTSKWTPCIQLKKYFFAEYYIVHRMKAYTWFWL